MSLFRTATVSSLRQTIILRPLNGATAIARHSSTSTESTSTSAPAAPAKSEDNAIPTWNDYFKLRKKRRTFEIVSSIPSAAVSSFGAMAYLSQLEIDPTVTFFGLDPLMATGIASVGAGFCGYFAGPVFANLLFKTFNSKVSHAMELRDKEFYEHIKANRVDASLQPLNSSLPDYYGEKIYSINDYRAWLRKQREQYRKAVFGGKSDGLE
ncbi:mitochondrial import protein Pam17-domain-containing protein [Dichotomocladium elegans]|nr:mitochondrial import protein Pam17-domain-containing protein [Dichotomocladium elegans]